MKVTRLSITNFRGVATATLDFAGHTLLVGPNNVGKSTVCEALDLVLGPDRLSKFPPVEEFDFYNSSYLESDKKTPRPLRIEVILTGLSAELRNSCPTHVEFWHNQQQRLLSAGELQLTDGASVEPCLRLETRGQYNLDEDEFEAHTFFSHSPNEVDGSLSGWGTFKRGFGRKQSSACAVWTRLSMRGRLTCVPSWNPLRSGLHNTSQCKAAVPPASSSFRNSPESICARRWSFSFR